MDDILAPGRQDQPGYQELLARLEKLEKRLSKMENQIAPGRAFRGDSPMTRDESDVLEQDSGDFITIDNTVIESKVVEYGLAGLGSLVLIFGITFLMLFTQNHWNSLLSSLLGYASVAGVFFIATYLRKSFRHMATMLTISGHLLAYYTTLRLFFFTAAPVIPSEFIGLILVLAALFVHLFYAIKRESQFEGGIVIVLILATALFCDRPYLTFPVIIMATATAMYLFIRQSWSVLLIVSMFLSYGAHILWFFGNPVIGNSFAVVTSHQYNFAYLFAYAMIFSLTSFVPQSEKFKKGIYTTTIILTGFLFSSVMMLNIITFFENSYVPVFAAISVMCMAYSVILKFRVDRLVDQSFFAVFSYMALSAVIYGMFKLPDGYYLLSIQSVLVLSMSLWYRSRIIVIMNTLMFVSITGAYIFTTPHPIDKINFTLAFTALISARIINWKKQGLDLKTESVRNTYLTVAFFTLLYALYHAVPPHYVTLSWTCAAVGYFIFSVILKNIKYRWMAILTLLVTAFYLFFVDLKNMEVGYRVIAFLFLAVISIGASLYYTKKILKKSKAEETAS